MKFFVTGGSRGIGWNIVITALKKGHDVAFTYCNNNTDIDALLKKAKQLAPEAMCRGYQLDVVNHKQVTEVIDQVLSDFDDIDAVVNNAGITKDNLVFNMSNQEWHDVINVNLTGSFYVIREFLPVFLAKKKGRFIGITSIAKDGISGQANYSASKAGLTGLSQSIAKEYGVKGITSNLISPGLFATDMTKKSEQLGKFWMQHCPLKRLGKLEEISQLVLFLSSDESSFINGEVISVTGGLNWAN